MSLCRRTLRRDCRAVAALEFAIVAPMFFVILLGGLELGLLEWTKNALQLTAAVTARCVALGSCADPNSYATATAGQWIMGNVISSVTYTPNTSCYAEGGTVYAKVTIDCRFWAGGVLPPPFSNVVLSVSACYPMVS
jgi:Flp pilus assembly protein TadG